MQGQGAVYLPLCPACWVGAGEKDVEGPEGQETTGSAKSPRSGEEEEEPPRNQGLFRV